MSKTNQIQLVLDYLIEFGSIDQYDAFLDLGIMRLASRVSDLKRLGYPIQSERVSVKNRRNKTCYISRYSLPQNGVVDQ